jgi:hypothetical protein
MQTAVYCRDTKRPAKIVFVRYIGRPDEDRSTPSGSAEVIVLSERRPRQQRVLCFGRRQKYRVL